MERGEPAPTPMRVPRGLRSFDETLRGLHGAAAGRDREALDLLASNRLIARELRVLQALLDLPSIGIIAVDNLGRVMMANRAAFALLKQDAKPARGRPLEDCFEEPALLELAAEGRDSEAARAPRTLDLAPDAASGRGHLTVTRRRGFGAGREAIGQVILIRDETGVKSAELTRTRFVESVDSFTRELRMPLGVIGAYLTELTELTDGEDGSEFILSLPREVAAPAPG